MPYWAVLWYLQGKVASIGFMQHWAHECTGPRATGFALFVVTFSLIAPVSLRRGDLFPIRGRVNKLQLERVNAILTPKVPEVVRLYVQQDALKRQHCKRGNHVTRADHDTCAV